MTGEDRKGRGDVGESVYGENAEMRLLFGFGDGINGDFNAIIMMIRCRMQHDEQVGRWDD